MANLRFPGELLCRPPAERLQYFHGFTMAHPQLHEAKGALMTAIDDAAPGSLVFVFGPTGVGKTTLLLRAEQLITQKMLPELESDPGRLPYVSVEAIAPETGIFSWKEHFRRVLASMDEPLIDFKVSAPEFTAKRDSKWYEVPNSMVMSTRLRHAVEQALSFRRPKAVFLDEAQQLAKMSSGRRLLDQLDVLKSTASRTQTVHVLVGTYDLLFFRNLSGQLSRRSVSIHFPRYRLDDEQEIDVFRNILLTFQDQLPLQTAPDLLASSQFLYERSIGCVGILKEWLTRALAQALRENQDTVSSAHLEVTALSVAQCQQMLSEAKAGEMMVAEGQDSRSRLQQELGLRDGVLQSVAKRSSQPGSIQGVSSRPKKRRVGERKPKRDQVGSRSLAYA
jgi:Cdc6-like AAA superfamily ATPase